MGLFPWLIMSHVHENAPFLASFLNLWLSQGLGSCWITWLVHEDITKGPNSRQKRIASPLHTPGLHLCTFPWEHSGLSPLRCYQARRLQKGYFFPRLRTEYEGLIYALLNNNTVQDSSVDISAATIEYLSGKILTQGDFLSQFAAIP